MDLSEVVSLAKAGDQRACTILTDTLAAVVMKTCTRLIPTEQEREDLSQETFASFFSSLKRFRYVDTASVIKFVQTIARHNCLRYLETRRAFSVYDEDIHEIEVDGERELEAVIHYKAIASLVEQLPLEMRIIFNLFVFEKCSHVMIAQLLKINEVTCRSYYLRAKKIIQQLIIQNDLIP